MAWVSRSSSTVTQNRNNNLNLSNSLSLFFDKPSPPPHPPFNQPWTEEIKMNSHLWNPFLIATIWFVTAPLSLGYTKQSFPINNWNSFWKIKLYILIICRLHKLKSSWGVRFWLSYTAILLTLQDDVFEQYL